MQNKSQQNCSAVELEFLGVNSGRGPEWHPRVHGGGGVKTDAVQHSFHLEEGDRMFLRNVGFDLPNYTASHHTQSNIQICTWLYDKSVEM